MDRAKALRLKRREKRLRIPALHEWLLTNYDQLKPRIEASGGSVSTNEVFERIHLEWMDSLSRDYAGKVCRPLGLFMEWKRIERDKSETESSDRCSTGTLLSTTTKPNFCSNPSNIPLHIR